ncbi:hypothetical protein KZZ52_16045 [Dactylosporangium sp. AC04546]|uniref:hypothetical protein n=1 Tax=Dactylosporangium sp. AC04546 TaxID=2862460 RepID=UPI001EDFC420|nr:hypothetical protein [Dactylosporangium sp. AC04546]WVK86815.1 hypothetical protein KZZ52_16045 [Dactylosporangium sp. AC04546]
MHDNDVRDLFARVVDEAGPLPVSREEMVAAGRRARNHRRRWWVGGVALAAVAAVAATIQVVPVPGAPVAVGASGTSGAPLTSGARSPGVAKSPTGRPVSKIPEAQQQRANQMLAALIAAIPAGYTTPAAGNPRTRSARVEGWQQTGWLYLVSTEVYRDGKVGAVRVSSFTDYGPPGTNDPCAAALQAAGSYDGCTVLTAVTGTPVAVSWRGGSGKAPRVVRATWVADDRAVSVEQLPQGTSGQPGGGMLDQPVFTDQELADLAGSPDFRG